MAEQMAEVLEERLLDFAIRAGKVVDALPNSRMGKHIASQLVRCGTSPAPNYSESCAAESKADFIHKLGIVFKELRESRIWLRMIVKGKLLPTTRMTKVSQECEELCKIIAKSLKTAKANRTRELRARRKKRH